MRARRYSEADADLSGLLGRTVAVIGYGNQGSAQSQNLRDSGVGVVIGNRDDPYRQHAERAGFTVLAIPEAAERGQVVLLLIPDEVQPAVFSEQVGPALRAGDTLVVASGYNLTFGLLDVPAGVDVVMVAPRMIGEAVRSRYQRGEPYPSLVSAERDASGQALATALAVARGIGATAGGAVASSAREEAVLDLFSEQAIWPTVLAVMRAGYEVLSRAGFSDDAILDELYLSGEPAEVFARASQMGLLGQLVTHSRTSQFGQLSNLIEMGDMQQALAGRFRAVLDSDILSGAFAKHWSSHAQNADDVIARLRDQVAGHPLLAAERAVRASAPQPAATDPPDDSGQR
jgi:ketol-acid reductoisomerase